MPGKHKIVMPLETLMLWNRPIGIDAGVPLVESVVTTMKSAEGLVDTMNTCAPIERNAQWREHLAVLMKRAVRMWQAEAITPCVEKADIAFAFRLAAWSAVAGNCITPPLREMTQAYCEVVHGIDPDGFTAACLRALARRIGPVRDFISSAGIDRYYGRVILLMADRDSVELFMPDVWRESGFPEQAEQILAPWFLKAQVITTLVWRE